MTSALAAVVAGAGARFAIERVEIPDPGADQILVRLEAASICRADIGARDGEFPVAYPIVLGHEGCGVVVKTGANVTTLQSGQRVVLTFDTCGDCRECRSGAVALCSEQLVRNWAGDRTTPRAKAGSTDVQLGFFGQSSFAEYAITSPRNTIAVPADVAPELLAPLGCGVQTGFGAVSNVLRPKAGDTIAVFGAGAVGMSALCALHLITGVTALVIEPDPVRRRLAVDLGASVVIDSQHSDLPGAIRGHSPHGLQGAVECSGHPSAFSAAVRSLNHGATVVLVGAPPAGTFAELDVFDLTLGSKRVVGSCEGNSNPAEMIPHLANLIEAGRLPVSRLIEAYPFDEIERAASDMTTGRVIKPVLTFCQGA